MICDWCGEEHYNPLLHVCFDGSTLRDRASLLRNGFTPPVRSLVKKSDPSFLKLTPDDIDLLIGMKIKW
jgi:hypothetical protein